jgi:hypothetical protein
LKKKLIICPNCQNFYKIDSPQFLINLVLTEKIKDDVDNDVIYHSIQDTINDVTNIKWCVCEKSLIEKNKYKEDFEHKLLESREETKIEYGFDLTLNKNIIYYKEKGENLFDKIAFITFVKDLKEQLNTSNENLSFNYINCSELADLDKKEIKKYITKYKYLLFFGLTNYISNGGQIKIFNDLITDRLVNGKKSFIMCETHDTLGQLFKEIDNNMYKNQKYLLEETKTLLSQKHGFTSRRISAIINKHGKSRITTSPIRGTKTTEKKVDKKETNPILKF